MSRISLNTLTLGLEIILGCSAAVAFIYHQKIRSLLKSIISPENLSMVPLGSSVIVEGIVKGGAFKTASSTGNYIFRKIEEGKLNKSMSFINCNVPIIEKSELFFLGHSQIPVKVNSNTIFSGEVVYQKIERLKLSIWDSIKSFFGNGVEYYAAKVERAIRLDNTVYVQGQLISGPDKKITISSDRVFMDLNQYLSAFQSRRNFMCFIFTLAGISLFITLTFKYYKTQTHKNALKSIALCGVCQDSANIIVTPCNHLSICKKCLFDAKICPMPLCTSVIAGYMLVVEI